MNRTKKKLFVVQRIQIVNHNNPLIDKNMIAKNKFANEISNQPDQFGLKLYNLEYKMEYKYFGAIGWRDPLSLFSCLQSASLKEFIV